MRRQFGIVLFLLAPGAFASCSDGGDDPLINACKVIVESCKRGPSVGQCLDDLGSMASDCAGCIAGRQCDYAECQSDIPGCRLPEYLLDPKDRIEPTSTPKPTDAGSGG